MTNRRWIAEQWDDKNAVLTGAQAQHLARVLRAYPGMKADIVAGGRVFHAAIDQVSADQVHFSLLSEVEAQPALPVTLVLSIYKFDRMEWAIEKATELGATAIVPVIARRTEKHLAQAAAKRVERWRRIAHESAQQSRRSDVPLIHHPSPLASFTRSASSATRFVLAEQETTTTLLGAVQDALTPAAEDVVPTFQIAVGPEGGWAPEEEDLFDEHRWLAITLGSRILRAETAAIAALSVIGSVLL